MRSQRVVLFVEITQPKVYKEKEKETYFTICIEGLVHRVILIAILNFFIHYFSGVRVHA